MSEVWHILRKDLRRLRWPLVAWVLIVIARLIVATTGAAAAFGNIGLQLAVENLSVLVTAIDLLMVALLVSWLVHDEPLVGVDAFWLTRPIDPLRLMAAKLVFAAVFLVAAPVAGESMVVATIAGGLHDAVRSAPGLALARTLWMLPLLALAALTPSLMRFLLVIAGSVAALAGLISVYMTLVVLTVSDDALDAPALPLEDPTGLIVESWLLIATSLGVILYQYRHRRLGRAVVLAAAGLVATAVIVSVWPWRFARPAEPDPGAWAGDARTVAILDADPPPYVTDAFGLRERTAARKLIAVPLHLVNAPPDASADSFAVRARLALPGGITLQSAQATNVPVRRPGRHVTPAQMTRVQAALGDVRLLGSDAGEYDQWPVVLKVTGQEYARYGQTPGRLTADVDALVYRSRLAGSMSLAAGAALRSGPTRFEMLQVVRRGDGCSVLVRQSMIGSFGRPLSSGAYLPLLRNTTRGEALTGEPEFMIGEGMHMGNWFVSSPGAGLGFSFVHLAYHYPARRPFESAPHIDAAWLDGADLALVETVYAGRVSSSIVAEGFKMGSPSAAP
jgi:hypothetical protein